MSYKWMSQIRNKSTKHLILYNKDIKESGHQLWSIVNNAGICYYGLLEWGTFDDCFKQFDINVFGAIRVTRKFIPLLRKSKGKLSSNTKYNEFI